MTPPNFCAKCTDYDLCEKCEAEGVRRTLLAGLEKARKARAAAMTTPNSASPSGEGEPLDVEACPAQPGPCAWDSSQTCTCCNKCAFACLEASFVAMHRGAEPPPTLSERRLRAYAAARTARPDGETL